MKCKKNSNKKEWMVIRYIKKHIKIPFKHNTSEMLQGCSKRRPDVYFESDKHCVVVEIDENQHKFYDDKCECARINEIVNGIGGKSVIFIRFNPDTVRNKNKKIDIALHTRLDLLINTIKLELSKHYDKFIVKTIQLYYNDEYHKYHEIKEEEITDQVCV